MKNINNQYNSIKIGDIEGIDYDPNYNIDGYSLPNWHNQIRNKNILELSNKDIGICLRQNILLEYILSEVLNRLNHDPTIGDKYDGETLNALYGIENDFWIKHNEYVNPTKTLLNDIVLGKLIPENFEWMYENQKSEFFELVQKFLKKLNEITIVSKEQ